jgi:hypothetical protein
MTGLLYSNCLPPFLKESERQRGRKNSRQVFVPGKKIQGFDLNFILGVFESTGDWAPEWGAHTHPFDELLVFFGFSNDLNYLGSEMELSMGREREKHAFDSPVVVVAPKNLPHCPLITKKVYQPFGHFHIALGERYIKDQKRVEQEGTTDGDTYTHLFKKMTVMRGPGGPDAGRYVTMTGAELEGMNVNITMSLFDKFGRWTAPTHVHPYNEVMVFFSLDQADINRLGAEMTVEIGRNTKAYVRLPTAIALPAGTPHCPYRNLQQGRKPYAVCRLG